MAQSFLRWRAVRWILDHRPSDKLITRHKHHSRNRRFQGRSLCSQRKTEAQVVFNRTRVGSWMEWYCRYLCSPSVWPPCQRVQWRTPRDDQRDVQAYSLYRSWWQRLNQLRCKNAQTFCILRAGAWSARSRANHLLATSLRWSWCEESLRNHFFCFERERVRCRQDQGLSEHRGCLLY